MTSDPPDLFGIGFFMRQAVFVSVVLSLGPQCALGAYDLRAYCSQHPTKDLTVFLNSFPYDAYLSGVRFTDFATLQRDRQFLRQVFGDGDPFLYRLGDHFVQHYALDPSYVSLSRRAKIGVAYLVQKRGLSRAADEIYQTIGYFLLGTVANSIEKAIAAKAFDPSSSNNAALITELEQHNIYISAEDSTASKLLTNIKTGRFSYLLSRSRSAVLDHQKPLVFALAFGLGVILIIWIAAIRMSMRVLEVWAASLGALCIVCLAGVIIVRLHGRNQTPAKAANSVPRQIVSNWHLSGLTQYYPLPGGVDYALRIFKIFDSNKNEVGQAVWLLRPTIGASYLAYHDVYHRLQRVRSQSSVVLDTTGGFTNRLAQPEGLTAESGSIVNAVLMHDRHALVVLEGGGIQVLDLKNQTFRLPNGGPVIASPLYSLLAYSQLLSWAKTHKATMFQTQLLAFSDKVTIDEKRAKPQLRERRLLALARDNRTSQVEHIIFNLPTFYYLPDVTKEVFGLLAARNKKIEALLNLDVGSYDILDVYDPNGNLIAAAHGKVEASHATNLIVYSK